MNLSKAEQIALVDTCPLSDNPRDLDECAECPHGSDYDESLCLFAEIDGDIIQDQRDKERDNLIADDNQWRER